MKKLAALLVLLALAACKETSAPSPSSSGPASASATAVTAASMAAPSASAAPPLADTGPAVSPSVASANNALAGDLYAKMRTAPGNLVFSPLSVSIALMMAQGGAKGATQTAMQKVLHVELGASHVGYGALANALASAAPGPTLRIANRVYAERTLTIVPGYLALTHDAYAAPLEQVDFKGAPEAARTTINGWVAQQTNETIKDLLAPRALDASTKLVLVSAIYFKGTWAKPFPAAATKPAPFHGTTTKNVLTMHGDLVLKHGGAREYEVVELPYADPSGTHAIVMDIVVPRPTSNLAAVEPLITGDGGAAMAKVMNATELLALALPKVKLESGTDLVNVLGALGMAPAFGNDADFTGMVEQAPGAERIRLSRVIHRAFAQIDEVGTEASAATAVIATDGMGAAPTPKPFVVDRPFLFLIRDVRSGAILFLGRMTDAT